MGIEANRQFYDFLFSNAPLVKKKILARNASEDPTYIAYSYQGTLTSQPSWRVEKLIYDIGGEYEESFWSSPRQIADNYLTLTYN